MCLLREISRCICCVRFLGIRHVCVCVVRSVLLGWINTFGVSVIKGTRCIRLIPIVLDDFIFWCNRVDPSDRV
jgi:hypothetical protein